MSKIILNYFYLCENADFSDFAIYQSTFVEPGILKISNLSISSALEVRFSSFFSGGFITAILVNPPEWKLVKRTFV